MEAPGGVGGSRSEGAAEAIGPRPDNRPFEPVALLSDAADIYRDNAVTLLTISAVVVIPARAISAGLILFATHRRGGVGSLGVPVALMGGLLVGLLPLATTVLASAASMQAVANAHVGGRPDWHASLHFATRRMRDVLFLTLLFAGGVTLGFALLFVPGVWVAVTWSLAMPALLLEAIEPKVALRRSARLVRHQWWVSCGRSVSGWS